MGVPATTGQLRTSIADMEIGDYIKVGWNSNNVCVLNEGSEEISYAGLKWGASLVGKFFYMIKAEKGLLISDRITHNEVAWDVLNSNKFIEGTSNKTNFNLGEGKIRSLTGGVAYSDENGNMSLTNKGFGGWPTNNEWDRFVVGFPQDKIQPGKTLDDIFHHTSMATWCQDTISLKLNNSLFRTVRGKIYVTDLFINNKSDRSQTQGPPGFRPVFQYDESKL